MHSLNTSVTSETMEVVDTNTSGLMARAAEIFLNSLSPDQRKKALFDFNSGERRNWDCRPGERRGLSFKDMDLAKMA